MHEACKKVKEGKPIKDWWGESGRPSLLPISKLTEMAHEHVSNSHGLEMKLQDVIDAAARHQTDLAMA
jgi:glucose-6-phosphate dehydrogenase assembly protein OpcA